MILQLRLLAPFILGAFFGLSQENKGFQEVTFKEIFNFLKSSHSNWETDQFLADGEGFSSQLEGSWQWTESRVHRWYGTQTTVSNFIDGAESYLTFRQGVSFHQLSDSIELAAGATKQDLETILGSLKRTVIYKSTKKWVVDNLTNECLKENFKLAYSKDALGFKFKVFVLPNTKYNVLFIEGENDSAIHLAWHCDYVEEVKRFVKFGNGEIVY